MHAHGQSFHVSFCVSPARVPLPPSKASLFSGVLTQMEAEMSFQGLYNEYTLVALGPEPSQVLGGTVLFEQGIWTT